MKRIACTIAWVDDLGQRHEEHCKTKKDAYAIERELRLNNPEVQITKSYD